MKKLLLISTTIVALSGCGNPFGVGGSKNSLSQMEGQPSLITQVDSGLIKLDPVPEGTSSIGGFVPVTDVSSEVVQIIQTQEPVAQTLPDQAVSVVEQVLESTETVISESVEQTSQVQESVGLDNSSEIVEEVSHEAGSVLENVVYIAPTVESIVNESPVAVNETLSVEQTGELTPSVDPVVPEENTAQSVTDMTKEVDSETVEALKQITYSDSTAENTTITYEKKSGKQEVYYVYSQSPTSYDWTKELAVHVKDGKVTLIQSLNKKDLSLFSTELETISAVEKEMSKKIKGSDTGSVKETVVSYIVKSKKNKKTYKMMNKKFGKKNKHWKSEDKKKDDDERKKDRD